MVAASGDARVAKIRLPTGRAILFLFPITLVPFGLHWEASFVLRVVAAASFIVLYTTIAVVFRLIPLEELQALWQLHSRRVPTDSVEHNAKPL